MPTRTLLQTLAILACFNAALARAEDLTDDQIKAKLNDIVSLKLDNVRLADAIPTIQALANVPIVLDPSVAAQGLDTAGFSINARTCAMRLALDSVMRNAGPGLGFTIKNGAVHIGYTDPMAARVSMVFQRADINNVIQTLGHQVNAPTVIDPAVKGVEFSLRFDNVRASAALGAITRMAEFVFRTDGKSIFVTPAADSKTQAAPAEIDAAAKADNEAARSHLATKVSYDFTDADVRDILNTCAIQANLNLLMDPKSSNKQRLVTYRGEDIQASKALDDLMKLARMHYTLVDGIVIVEADEPLKSRVSLDLEGGYIEDAIKSLGEQTEATIELDSKLAETNVKTPKMTVLIHEMPAEIALNWIARLSRLECRFQAGTVLITIPKAVTGKPLSKMAAPSIQAENDAQKMKLEKKVPLQFDKTPLLAALQKIGTESEISLILDPDLAKTGTTTREIVFRSESETLSTALATLLKSVGLRSTLVDGALFIGPDTAPEIQSFGLE